MTPVRALSSLRSSVLTATVAFASDTAGVVTYVPQRATCTGAVVSSHTLR